MSVIVKEVTRYFGKQKALNNVSFSIKAGEIVGFLGPNGAGKSTMMKIITGYLPPSSGGVEVCGTKVEDHTLELRRKIGYLPEHNPLYLDMYVREYLEMVGGIYSIPQLKGRIEDMIQRTGLYREAHKKIGALSKGYRQRVGLAQALLPDPEVLILDEPTTGLDPNQIVEVRDLIKAVGQEKTIMLSTHIMQEVEAICERVIIINKGEVVADQDAGSLSTLKSGNEHVLTVEFANLEKPSMLNDIVGVSQVKPLTKNRWLLTVDSSKDIRPEVFHFAVRNELILLGMTQEKKDLESVFQDLTKESGSQSFQ